MAEEATAIANFNIRNAPNMYLVNQDGAQCVELCLRRHLPMFNKVKVVPGTRKLHSITKGYDNPTVNQRVTSYSCA